MGGYIPHPRIDEALATLRAAGPIWESDNLERLLIGAVYRQLCWEFLGDVVPPHVLAELERRVDDLIRADALKRAEMP